MESKLFPISYIALFSIIFPDCIFQWLHWMLWKWGCRHNNRCNQLVRNTCHCLILYRNYFQNFTVHLFLNYGFLFENYGQKNIFVQQNMNRTIWTKLWYHNNLFTLLNWMPRVLYIVEKKKKRQPFPPKYPYFMRVSMENCQIEPAPYEISEFLCCPLIISKVWSCPWIVNSKLAIPIDPYTSVFPIHRAVNTFLRLW